jgi:hypothetical protein
LGPTGVNRPEAVMNAELNMKSIVDGLDNFQLKPEGKTGIELFQHMCTFRRRTTENEHHKISDSLNVSPHGKHQNQLMKRSYQDMIDANVFLDVTKGGELKLARRRLNCFGEMKNECALVNSEEILKEWAQKAQIAASLEEINEKEELAANKEKELEISEYLDIVDGSVQKLKTKKGVVADITVKEIKAILVCIYKVEPPKGNKIKQVTALEEEIKKDQPRLFGNEETNLEQPLPNLEQTLPLPQAAQEQDNLERPVGSAVNL